VAGKVPPVDGRCWDGWWPKFDVRGEICGRCVGATQIAGRPAPHRSVVPAKRVGARGADSKGISDDRRGDAVDTRHKRGDAKGADRNTTTGCAYVIEGNLRFARTTIYSLGILTLAFALCASLLPAKSTGAPMPVALRTSIGILCAGALGLAPSAGVC